MSPTPESSEHVELSNPAHGDARSRNVLLVMLKDYKWWWTVGVAVVSGVWAYYNFVVDQGEVKAQQIRECMKQHDLKRAEVVADSPKNPVSRFRSCGWPPPPGADPDGYSEITAQTSSGPLEDPLASGMTSNDVITSPNCEETEVVYVFGQMGDTWKNRVVVTPGKIYVASTGERVSEESVNEMVGGFWDGPDLAENESLILHSRVYDRESAECLS